ncbi:hypothetical protein NDU88_003185 [Pleurodeles waltl]|uniref:Uncharacterized protein n=1 Tax=Pleurodeles waltl TaxID=8319 RepID=A0AAV7NJ63_PLEWA|nr:hypothetical protein NDU88_003185 [Pleurodeles waltl]
MRGTERGGILLKAGVTASLDSMRYSSKKEQGGKPIFLPWKSLLRVQKAAPKRGPRKQLANNKRLHWPQANAASRKNPRNGAPILGVSLIRNDPLFCPGSPKGRGRSASLIRLLAFKAHRLQRHAVTGASAGRERACDRGVSARLIRLLAFKARRLQRHAVTGASAGRERARDRGVYTAAMFS